MSKAEQQNPKKPSIDTQIAELDAAVEWFYGEDFTLDQALEKYQKATKLAQKIEQDLAKFKNHVEVVEDFTKC